MTDGASPGQHGPVLLRPDPRHRLPGRGAWVHPRPDCLELAVRRKAFGRALRLQAAVDVTAVAEHLAGQHAHDPVEGLPADHREEESTNHKVG